MPKHVPRLSDTKLKKLQDLKRDTGLSDIEISRRSDIPVSIASVNLIFKGATGCTIEKYNEFVRILKIEQRIKKYIEKHTK